ncbi:MAG: DUF4158 domain-containing protein [Vulcanimicrobiota bacterium]
MSLPTALFGATVKSYSARSVPRRSLLTLAERQSLLAFPEAREDLALHYTFSDSDLAVIRQHRGGQNRLGFAVQLCSLRYPGCVLPTDAQPPEPLLSFVSRQLRLNSDLWPQYAQRAETRREHLLSCRPGWALLRLVLITPGITLSILPTWRSRLNAAWCAGDRLGDCTSPAENHRPRLMF